MMKNALVITFLLCAAIASGQQVKRSYDISFIHYLWESLDKEEELGYPKSISKTNVVAVEGEADFSSEAELMKVIREKISPNSWENPGNKISIYHGVLHVTQIPEIQEQIAQILELIKNKMTAQVVLNIQIYKIVEAEFAQKFSQLPLAKIATEIGKYKTAKRLQKLQLSGFAGQSMQLADIQKRWYLSDQEIEIASGYSISDPVHSAINTGNLCNITAFVHPGGRHLYLRGGFQLADCEELRKFTSKDLGHWQLPRVALQGFMGVSQVEVGVPTVFGIYTKNGDIYIHIVTANILSNQKQSSQFAIFDTRYFSETFKNYKIADYVSPLDIIHQKMVTMATAVFAMEDVSNMQNLLPKYTKKDASSFYYNGLLVAPKSLQQQTQKQLNDSFTAASPALSVQIVAHLLNPVARAEAQDKLTNGELSAEDYTWLINSSQKRDYLQTRTTKGSRAVAYSLLSHDFVRDYDVEVAQQAGAFDPIMGSASAGFCVETTLKTKLAEDKWLLNLDALYTFVKLPMRQIKVSDTFSELPDMQYHRIRGKFIVSPGKKYLLGSSEQEGNARVFTICVE